MTMPAITVRRSAPELVVPARPTPYELKTLSDIDDQQGMRFYRSGVHIYRRSDAKAGDDPAAVLRNALAEALVHYYPIAGRIREATPGAAGSKLLVECTGEGAVFVEADADVTLEDLGAVTGPPVPYHEQFLCEPDGAFIGATVVGRPLLFFQVTRMRCGGFVWGLQICHCLADAAGTSQLLTAISEFARGVPDAPTVPPVWAREILLARSPPQAITRQHPEYEPVPDAGRDKVYPGDALVHRNFFFGHREIAALRALATPELASKSSRFDLIAAFMWRCRANALMYDDEDLVRVQFVVNARGRKGMSLVVPQGFYGNAFSFAVAESAAGELRRRTYGHALGLVVDAKAHAMEDGHLQSVADERASAVRSGTHICRVGYHAGRAKRCGRWMGSRGIRRTRDGDPCNVSPSGEERGRRGGCAGPYAAAGTSHGEAKVRGGKWARCHRDRCSDRLQFV